MSPYSLSWASLYRLLQSELLGYNRCGTKSKIIKTQHLLNKLRHEKITGNWRDVLIRRSPTIRYYCIIIMKLKYLCFRETFSLSFIGFLDHNYPGLNYFHVIEIFFLIQAQDGFWLIWLQCIVHLKCSSSSFFFPFSSFFFEIGGPEFGLRLATCLIFEGILIPRTPFNSQWIVRQNNK